MSEYIAGSRMEILAQGSFDYVEFIGYLRDSGVCVVRHDNGECSYWAESNLRLVGQGEGGSSMSSERKFKAGDEVTYATGGDRGIVVGYLTPYTDANRVAVELDDGSGYTCVEWWYEENVELAPADPKHKLALSVVENLMDLNDDDVQGDCELLSGNINWDYSDTERNALFALVIDALTQYESQCKTDSP